MKKFLALLSTLFLVACGNTTKHEITVNGKDGKDGSSCTTEQLANGALIKCTDGTMSIIYNGTNGADAPTTFGVAGFIFPCDNKTGNKEVFLRMTDNSILALYDGGANADRLTILQPGNYVTTDGVTCNINVDNLGNVTTSPVAATGLWEAL